MKVVSLPTLRPGTEVIVKYESYQGSTAVHQRAAQHVYTETLV